MHKNYNITLAHIMKFLIGLGLGSMFISSYMITIGSGFHFGSDAFSIMLIGLAFCFTVEYFLEISSGYRADVFGEKLTLFFSFVTRILYAGLILGSIALINPSPALFVIMILAANSMFAISYTLMSGNFEEWLQKQCDEKNSLKTFSKNYAAMYFGLVVGLSLSVMILPSYNYATLFTEASPIYGIAIIANFLALLLVFAMRDTKGFGLRDVPKFFASYFTFDRKAYEDSQQKIKQVRKELKKQKNLDRLFWVSSIAYGIDIAYETLIPVYVFASQGFNLEQKFILIILCYLLPNVIGALTRSEKKSTAHHSIGLLSKELYQFFTLSILVAVISIFPFSQDGIWYLDPVFLAFGLAIILFQIVTGRVYPHFHDCCSKLAREHSELPKTLLSIGERRKKIGAILSLVISAGAAIFSIKEAYFWVLAVMALGGIIYSYHVFKHLSDETDTDQDIEQAKGV